MAAIRSWDLGSGRPVPVLAQGKPQEIVIFQAVDPLSSEFIDGPFPAASYQFDVFGCDRRLAIVLQHFFVRAQWYTGYRAGIEALAGGVADIPGESLAVTVEAWAIKRTHDGAIVELGKISTAYWLNGGSAPDGIEIVSGMDGVRLKFALSAASLPGPTPNYWNLVATVEAKPNTRIGCGEVVEEIAQALQIVVPRQPAAYQAELPD